MPQKHQRFPQSLNKTPGAKSGKDSAELIWVVGWGGRGEGDFPTVIREDIRFFSPEKLLMKIYMGDKTFLGSPLYPMSAQQYHISILSAQQCHIYILSAQQYHISIEEGFIQKARQTVIVSVWGGRLYAALRICCLNMWYCVHSLYFSLYFCWMGGCFM